MFSFMMTVCVHEATFSLVCVYFLAALLLSITSLDTISFCWHSNKHINQLYNLIPECLRALVCAAKLEPKKEVIIMIQSDKSMPCTVINTRQINPCETDVSSSAIKQDFYSCSKQPEHLKHVSHFCVL